MSASLPLAITGGTGFVGQALLDAAAKAKQPMRAMARRNPPERAGVEWVEGDLDDKDALFRLVDGARAVVHIAGLTSSHDLAAFDAVNVVGTLNLIEACKQAQVGRLIFISSLAAREPSLSAYGASKARAEKLVKASGLEWTIVRPPGVYGPRDVDYFEMFRAARRGILPMPAQGASSMIHVRDLAELLLALVPGGEDISFETFEPDDGREGGWDHRELARSIGWAVGSRPWVPRLSRTMLERAARVDRFLRKDKARLTPDRVSYLSHPDWVVSRSARVPEALWRPRIPTRHGLKATARWYKDKGWM